MTTDEQQQRPVTRQEMEAFRREVMAAVSDVLHFQTETMREFIEDYVVGMGKIVRDGNADTRSMLQAIMDQTDRLAAIFSGERCEPKAKTEH